MWRRGLLGAAGKSPLWQPGRRQTCHRTEFGAGQVVRIPPQAAQNLDLSVKCRFFSTDVGDNLATPRYTEASIRVLKGLEPVRKRPGMYTRTENPLHVVQEVIDHPADDALAGYGKQIQELGRASCRERGCPYVE